MGDDFSNRGPSALVPSGDLTGAGELHAVLSASLATKTFLFTDIEGSTRMWERAPETMRDALARHDELMRAAVERHGGTVFKTIGDAFCCVFERPDAALLAAIDAQRALAAEAWPEEIGTLRVRAGLHCGEVAARDDDYFGPTLNRVARLMAVGHGGQILLSGAIESALRGKTDATIALRDLGSHRLKDLGRAETIFQVTTSGLASDFAPLTSLDAHPNNLPLQISSFVGRERELERLRALCIEHRLVTIAGMGGIGKTRLALQVAAEASDAFKDGCWFAGLAEIDDEAQIPQMVADALRVRGNAAEPIERTLLDYLEKRRALLVLDNAEHLRTGVAKFVRDLLERCADLHVLLTTREPLHVAGEHIERIGSLDDARRLFLERARAAKPELAGTAETIASADAICAKLEGIPLAIELAAARVSSISLKQLEERLTHQLALLVSKDPTLGERRRTLRGTIDWSYRLLTPSEQQFWAALSVFEGSFSFEAAEAVAYDENCYEMAIDLLESLVDKSLIAHTIDGETSRYTLQGALDRFAAEQLVEAKAVEPALRRMCAHYREFSASIAATHGDNLEQAIASVALDWSNIRRALQAAFEVGGDFEAGRAIVLSLVPLWVESGRYAEGAQWVEVALRHSAAIDSTRLELLRQAATIAHTRGDHAAHLALSEEMLESYEGSEDALAYGHALIAAGIARYNIGDGGAAETFFRRALEQCRIADDPGLIGTALLDIGAVMVTYHLDYEAARPIYEECLAIFRDLGVSRKLSMILSNLGGVAGATGDYRAAIAYTRESIEVLERLGNAAEMASLFFCMSDYHRELGEYGLACETLAAARRALKMEPNRRDSIYYFETAARLAADLGADDVAATIFGFTETSRAALGMPPRPTDIAAHHKVRAKLAARLGEETLERLIREGRSADEDALQARIEKLAPPAHETSA
jgi:predicted ATPase/class 3 adenylate cyclase